MSLSYLGLYVYLPWRYTSYFEGICTNNYHKNMMEATVFSNTPLLEGGRRGISLTS